MDEARLQAIEAAIPPAIEDPGGDDFSLAVNTIHELIAALREMTRQRDHLLAALGRASLTPKGQRQFEALCAVGEEIFRYPDSPHMWFEGLRLALDHPRVE